jgi:peptidoglycan/xylan/chitin deacetylase (PgdA/CDA1 family)
MGRLEKVARPLSRIGAERLLKLLWGPERLTVLGYHRVVDASGSGFSYCRANVSASPAMFERQMAYVARHFNVIALSSLVAFVRDGVPLPPRPLLITFDDGYGDNYRDAFPVLRSFGFPAVFFLPTAYIDRPIVPWWDAVSYYFHHTRKRSALLPGLGQHELATRELREEAARGLMRHLKQLPEEVKQQSLEELPEALGVAPPLPDPGLFLTWDQARELVAAGIACQPHTATHPILARVSPQEARRQLRESRDRIEQETGEPVVAFSYPNGQPGDYDVHTIEALRELDFTVAFTLSPGPVRCAQVREDPLEIPRTYVVHSDSLEVFGMRIHGLPDLKQLVTLPAPAASPWRATSAPGRGAMGTAGADNS